MAARRPQPVSEEFSERNLHFPQRGAEERQYHEWRGDQRADERADNAYVVHQHDADDKIDDHCGERRPKDRSCPTDADKNPK